MRGSAVFRTGVAPGGALAGPWVQNPLWTAARAVPSLDLRFAENKSLVDATTGASLVTFTRASTGTYVGADGLVKTATTNEARFGHNPTTGESLGLLVEEARTNLQTNSENIASLGTLLGSTITSNAITAPDGQTTADKLIEDTSTGGHQVSGISISWAGNTTYTASVYAKADTRTVLTVAFGTSSNWVNNSRTVTFNLSSATIATSGAPLVASIQALPNGWYRCIVSATTVAAPVASTLVFQLNNGSTTSYTGDGTSGLFLWGAQLEAGAFATSYIPTTTAAATRSADVASITGSAFSGWYRQDEGTVFAEALAQEYTVTAFPRVFSIDDGGATSSFIALARGNNIRRWDYSVFANGAGQAVGLNNGNNPSAGAVCRGAVIYRANDFTGATQGVLMNADTSGSVPTVNALGIGMQSNAILQFNGTIRRLTYWPVRLGNNVLQQITQ